MRAVIYLRQSRDALADGLAVDRQRQDCEKLCADRGWQVVRTITENDTSASVGHRPGYAELLALADARAVDVLVCWHLDRLTRRLTELEDVIGRCESANVRVATVSGDLDLSTDAGRLVGRILASVARGEVERKSTRQKRASRQAAEAGSPPARRAFGFTPDAGHDPAEAPAVAELYARVLAGMSLVAATRWLNEAGHRTTTGREWERTAVRTLLLNPRYCGLRTLRKQIVGPGCWEPIVTEDVWRAAVELLTDPARLKSSGGGARRWLGGGLFRCGKCGAGVRVNYDRTGSRAYMCKAHSHLSRKADPVDDLVQAVIVARLNRPDLAGLLAADAPDTAPLREHAGALRARLDNVTIDYAEGLLTARQLHQVTERIEAQLATAEQRLAEAGRATRLGWLAAAADPGQAFLDAELGRQRAVIDALCTVHLLAGRVGRGPFDPESVRIEWRPS